MAVVSRPPEYAKITFSFIMYASGMFVSFFVWVHHTPFQMEMQHLFCINKRIFLIFCMKTKILLNNMHKRCIVMRWKQDGIISNYFVEI